MSTSERCVFLYYLLPVINSINISIIFNPSLCATRSSLASLAVFKERAETSPIEEAWTPSVCWTKLPAVSPSLTCIWTCHDWGTMTCGSLRPLCGTWILIFSRVFFAKIFSTELYSCTCTIVVTTYLGRMTDCLVLFVAFTFAEPMSRLGTMLFAKFVTAIFSSVETYFFAITNFHNNSFLLCSKRLLHFYSLSTEVSSWAW